MNKHVQRPNEPPMEEPIAYFLTWTSYGTWLPGDERGWIAYRRGWQLPSPVRKLNAKSRMTETECILDEEQRALVEATITKHCQIRGWELHAVKCRSNHVHVVVTADLDPSEIRDQLKAWCTRRLKELDQQRYGKNRLPRKKWWAEGGSKRYINDEDSLEAAIEYVVYGQDRTREYEFHIWKQKPI